MCIPSLVHSGVITYSSVCTFQCFLVFALQAAFIVFIGPFAFFNIQRTKILQLITSVLRNLSQWLMHMHTHTHTHAHTYTAVIFISCNIYSFLKPPAKWKVTLAKFQTLSVCVKGFNCIFKNTAYKNGKCAKPGVLNE